MAKKMTMADIAHLSGVGKSTVSRYFNGGYVKDETRAKIQKVIEEYNYTPNAFARLNAKQSNVIGVVVPTLNSKITSRVITSIDRYLREKGYTTLIQNSDHDIDQELQNIQRLIQLNVDGILISSIAITKDHKELLKKAGIPVVVLTQDYEDGISIIYDDYHAGKTMGEYIGKKGHKKVDDMINSFANNMAQQGLSIQQYMQFTGMTMEAFRDQVRPDALERTQSSLVLEAIAKAVNIQATDEDVDAKVAEMAAMYGMEADQLKNLVGENERESMKKDIAIEKALDLIMDNVKATAKKAAKKDDEAESEDAE